MSWNISKLPYNKSSWHITISADGQEIKSWFQVPKYFPTDDGQEGQTEIRECMFLLQRHINRPTIHKFNNYYKHIFILSPSNSYTYKIKAYSERISSPSYQDI